MKARYMLVLILLYCCENTKEVIDIANLEDYQEENGRMYINTMLDSYYIYKNDTINVGEQYEEMQVFQEFLLKNTSYLKVKEPIEYSYMKNLYINDDLGTFQILLYNNELLLDSLAVDNYDLLTLSSNSVLINAIFSTNYKLDDDEIFELYDNVTYSPKFLRKDIRYSVSE